jgi:tRNA dimethylallyltransferase
VATDGSVIVVVGPTASGKTALAIKLAKLFNGEIIAADSRTVYKHMDIGTAKPTKQEQAEIRHHLIDVVNPDGYFSAADFKELAQKAIADIESRNKLPIVVGGTGLYIDALIYDFGFASPEIAKRRDPKNPRHLDKSVTSNRGELRANTLIIGLKMPREALRARIAQRVDAMFKAGFIEETKALAKAYGWQLRSLQTPGYKAMRKYLEGQLTLDETKEEFIKNDLNLAKRQMTWFKRNNSIHWLGDPREAVEIVTTFLNKINS